MQSKMAVAQELYELTVCMYIMDDANAGVVYSVLCFVMLCFVFQTNVIPGVLPK